MLDKLGTLGIVGIVVTVAGLAIVAWQNLLLAAGLAIMLAGVGLVAAGLVKNVLASFGLA
ncbi:hypothetical protein GJ629_13280 [Halapricum sp. CBA1109]|jgi:hypothetical protein|uniref:DUF7470 family protein n=1 Tax=Halapricum sp. CBA1109 TaxID=2668068 RepID=UPI0012FC958B|nr:hypothetical protein [Halapricum sp. CBA1109]MUV90751.1 hypothetical protein [Halapricum sp. CBA1109]